MEKKRPQRRPLCLLGAVVVLSPHRAPNPGPTSNEKHRGTAWNYQSRQALRREPAARPASVALRERGGEPEEAGSEVVKPEVDRAGVCPGVAGLALKSLRSG